MTGFMNAGRDGFSVVCGFCFTLNRIKEN